MKNLISMTDFVLEQGYNPLQNDMECWLKSHKYAEFLKQPLELWMFVPCDENGNFLEEPYMVFADDSEECEAYIEMYCKAKEKVLFEECVYDIEMDAVRKNTGLMIYSVKYDSNDKIEDLVKYDTELTQTAIKKQQL